MSTFSLKLASRQLGIFNLCFRNFYLESINSSLNLSSKSNSNLFAHKITPNYQRSNNFSVDFVLQGSAARAETTSTTQGLNKLQAQELILRLNSEERTVLYSALQEYQSKLVKDEYQGV